VSKATDEGAPITWRTVSKKVRAVKKGRIVTKREGKCVVRGTAPATATARTYQVRHVIVVR
jgi:hypothetical protein